MVRGEFEVRVKEKGPLGLTMEPLTAPGLTNFASSLPHITAAAGQSADAFENGLQSLSADGKCCVIVGVRVRFGRSVRYVGPRGRANVNTGTWEKQSDRRPAVSLKRIAKNGEAVDLEAANKLNQSNIHEVTRVSVSHKKSIKILLTNIVCLFHY